MDQSAIIERLEEIQGIVEQQEKDSMELKKQLQRLEQVNSIIAVFEIARIVN